MRTGKGFVISMSTILVFITVVWFAVFYAGNVGRSEANALETYRVLKAGFVVDDLVYDLNQMLGTSVDVNKGLAFTVIEFRDIIPSDVNKMQLLDWNSFVDGNYAARQNASIRLGIERLVDKKTEIVFSNDLQYDYAYGLDQNFVLVRKGNGSNTNAITYDINVFVQGARLDASTPWTCDSTGDVNVNLRYLDSYGESENSLNCKQDPAGIYVYTFTFQSLGGSLVVSFGNIDGNSNAAKVRNTIESTGVSVASSIRAEFASEAGGISWFYDADLNYVQQDVNLNRKFELGRA